MKFYLKINRKTKTKIESKIKLYDNDYNIKLLNCVY